MNPYHVETIGRYLIRRRIGRRWMYALPSPLGELPRLAWWTRHRSRAGRFTTRRAAWRHVFRLGTSAPPPGTWEIVTVETWYGPLADGSPQDLPIVRQALLPFMTTRKDRP